VDGVEQTALPLSQPSSIPDGIHWTWWVKEVAFEAGATRVIRERYVARPGGDSTGNLWFEYILETGASWAGPIGIADIVITFRDPIEEGSVTIAPEGWHGATNELAWHLENFEPGEAGRNAEVSLLWKPRAEPRVEGRGETSGVRR
jgi:hypothetical protein